MIQDPPAFEPQLRGGFAASIAEKEPGGELL
jgi:hypothetical protein